MGAEREPVKRALNPPTLPRNPACSQVVVRWTITVVDGQPLGEGFAAFLQRYGAIADPPTISVHVVAGLANPAFLVEIDAIAVR